MSSFPQIVRRSNEAILSFGHIDGSFCRYPGSGSPHLLSPSVIPNSLQRLKILVGGEFSDTDNRALVTSLEHIRSHCWNLESVSVIADAHLWEERAAFVREWGSLPLVRYKERIIDQDWNTELSTYSRKYGSKWERTSHISFPVDRVNELAHSVCQIPQVTVLSLLPAMEQSRVLDNNSRRSIVRGLAQLLRRLPDLRKISLPLEFSSRIDLFLTIASSLHHCCAVELSAASLVTPTQVLLTNLAAGFHQFDHLRKLGLPAYVLRDGLCVCLGELQGLQKLTIMATSHIPVLSPAAPYRYPMLRTLKLSGSKALSYDLENAFCAFVHPHNSAIRRVVVEVGHLTRRKEMKDTLSVIVQHRGQINELDIHIHGIHGSERKEWMDLSLLSSLPNLRRFAVTHPRPLPLTDKDIGSLMSALPSAKVLSFNPRPTLPPWYRLPTLNCLTDVAKEGTSLCHFGIHLDPRPSYHGDLSSHSRLEELDLGEVAVSIQQATQLRQLFPNATQL
jgi:hypothetical protein